MRPRCPSVGPNGYRCRKRLHGPVPADPMPPLDICHVAYGWQGSDYWDDETAMDPPEQHVSTGDGEVVWDVNMLAAIAATKEPRPIRVDQHVDYDHVNPRHWRTVDIHTPVILVPHPDTGHATVVDGRHRLYKAHQQGRAFVPGVLLTRTEEQRCRLTDDEAERKDREYAEARARGWAR